MNERGRRRICVGTLLVALSAGVGLARATSSAATEGAQTTSNVGVELTELTWVEAEEVLTPDSIVVLPLGAASKEHGPHLRLDNDFRMAEYLKRRVLAVADVVVAPTLSYHFYPSFLEYPGSTHLGFETSRDMVVDIVRSLAGYGPRKFYVLNTGVSTLRPLQESADILRAEGILLRFTNILEVAAAAEEQVREQVRGTHADELETSMMLYIAPDRVDMSLAVREDNPRGQGGLTRRADGTGTYSASGVWGDATLATVEKGRIIVEATVEGILRDIEALRRAEVSGPVAVQSETYDPLAVFTQQRGSAVADRRRPETLDLVVHDAERQRAIPILVYLPPQKSPAPVVLFSHGLGGSRHGSSYLGRHWSARGYLAVFVQHPGSDVSVGQDKPARERMETLQGAASLQNTLLRVHDIPAVLDQLEAWNATDGHALAGRMNLERIGMSGHSFGAVTTQAVSGQSALRGNLSFTDTRIDAAIAFSPSSPRWGRPEQAFGLVEIPWMLMTGTNDTAPIGNADVASRLAVFPALPPGGKYELVLDAAEHSAFTERALPGDTGPRNPNHHRVILALSTAFWDAWLRDDAAARAWLDGDGPRSVLEKDDRWQVK